MAVSAVALVISLSNSLGAMAGRGNEQQAERMRVADTVRDLRRGLERAESERKGLEVRAGRRSRRQCGESEGDSRERGQRGRVPMAWPTLPGQGDSREPPLLLTLETATKNKAATDRAAKLDSDIAAFREKIERAGPVLEANSQGNALARLFNLPEAKAATLSTYQNLAMAIVIELLIVMSMVASEVLEHHETKTPAPEVRPTTEAASIPVGQTAAATPLTRPAEAASVAEALPYDEDPKVFPAASRPRLISSQPNPLGSVPVILAEIMEPGRGEVSLLELFSAYEGACRAKEKEPVSASEFSHTVAALCERLGVQVEDNDDGVFLMQVRLKPAARNKGKSAKRRATT